jgi:methylmalonyl-CoA mutase N-terminal domain/subunit
VAADPEANLMPALLDATRTYATLGELMRAMGDVFGYYTETPVL